MKNLQIRWSVRGDLPRILEIENQSYSDRPWTEEDFLEVLRDHSYIGMVAQAGGSGKSQDIVGYMLYSLEHDRIGIANIAVAPEARRQGVGRKMLRRLKDKLLQQKHREYLRASVRESNLATQLWLRDSGFECVDIDRDVLRDYGIDEDAYQFEWHLWWSELATLDDELMEG